MQFISFETTKTIENGNENHNSINYANHELLMMDIDCEATTKQAKNKTTKKVLHNNITGS